MCCATRASPIRPISRRSPISCSSRWTRSASTLIGEPSLLTAGSRWEDIKELAGEALATKYGKLLETLSRQSGVIGAIFLKAQNEIQDPAKLKRLVGLIDSETWLSLPVDVKGEIYEGLLARNAEDVKSGAGQYFTPRPLIEAMVEVVDPDPSQSVHDPACGTGGFLLAAWEHMKKNPRARQKDVYQALRTQVLRHRHRAGGRAARGDEPLSARHHRRRDDDRAEGRAAQRRQPRL